MKKSKKCNKRRLWQRKNVKNIDKTQNSVNSPESVEVHAPLFSLGENGGAYFYTPKENKIRYKAKNVRFLHYIKEIGVNKTKTPCGKRKNFVPDEQELPCYCR